MFIAKKIKLPQYRVIQRTVTMSSEGSNGNTWRGVPLSEIYGSSSPWGAPEFPLVTPGYSHTVLYHIPSNSEFPSDRPPKPQVSSDKWDQDHVRLPCSSRSLYPVRDRQGEVHLKKRWEIIEAALWKPIRNSHELADAILSYNIKFKEVWEFNALHKLFEEFLEEEESQYFFDVTLPEIAKLALSLPKLIQAPIPLLKQNKNHSISLSQQQIACLLANAFFCTFPRRNTDKRNSEYSSYPFINFNRLYESCGSEHVLEKLKCICHYFRRVTTKAAVGVVTFSRRFVPSKKLPDWGTVNNSLAELPVYVDSGGTIEDADGLIQVDFANKYLGGGVLNYGCVQEEIRFVICPELMVSMLFTEVLKFNEALMIIGSERYSKYSGYGNTFQWSGDYLDRSPWDSSHRRRTAVLAIDATPHRYNGEEQYSERAVVRELNKAWVGFSFYTSEQVLEYPGVATGNWGCGAFGGAPQLKSLLQLMACARARRPMAYYTFGDHGIRDGIVGMCNLFSRYNVTVGQLYKYILMFSEIDNQTTGLHTYLHQIIMEQNQRVPKQLTPRDEPIQITDTSMEEVNSEIQREFQIDFQKQSPDLFSQDEDESLIEIQVHNIKDATPSKLDQTQAKSSSSFEQNRTSKTNNQSQISKFVDQSNQSSKSIEHSSQLVESPKLFESSSTSKSIELSQTSKFIDQSNLSSKLVEQSHTSKSNDQHNISKPVEDSRSPKPVEQNRSSRLVEEMQKLDDATGHKVSVSKPSPFKHNSSISLHDTSTPMDTSDCSDPKAEFKKRVSRKITDYFGKKTL